MTTTEEQLAKALSALVDRLDEVHAHPMYQAVWECAFAHHGPYTGPRYFEQLEVARDTIAAAEKGSAAP